MLNGMRKPVPSVWMPAGFQRVLPLSRRFGLSALREMYSLGSIAKNRSGGKFP